MKKNLNFFFFLYLFFILNEDHPSQGRIITAEDIPEDEWFKEKKLVKLLLSSHDGRQLGRPSTNA